MSLIQMNHPKLILFRELIIQLLTIIKQDLRKTKLDQINIQNILAQDTTMDPSKYLDYFIIGLSNNKTKQITLSFLEKLYKQQGVVSRRSLSKQFLTTIIKTIQVQNYSLSMCRFLGALLTNEDTRISNQDKQKALLYLLAVSRNKLLNSAVQSILLDVFSFLAPRSEAEIKSFLPYYINWIVNEVDLHSAEDIQYSLQLHKHQNLDFAYGRCFMCNNIAKNYHKEMKIPICGLQCKQKFSRLQQKAQNRQTFNLFDWLIEQSVHKDEIIFRQIEKELRAVMKNLTEKQLKTLFPQLMFHAKSGNKQMALLCHRIFVGLFHGHKQMLKKQLGSYLKEMINQLQSSKEPYQISSLLQLFQQLYKQPDNIRWIYANYDCKYYQVNLLQEQLALLTKISIGQQFQVAKQAKHCLTVFLRSLIEGMRVIKVRQDVYQDQSLLEERKVKQKADQGIRLFNEKPRIGIEYLKQNYLSGEEMTVTDLARFIRQNQSKESRGGRLKLKKDKIGQFFQQNKPYNIQVYKQFLKLLDFQGLTIDDAIRQLMSHFTLGKQAQQIERVVDHFSQRFFQYSKLPDVDSCFYLSYTILMLQSNLHNVQVKQKMTLADFAKLCTTVKGISPDELQRIYNSIKSTQLSQKPQLSSEYLLQKAYLNAYDKNEQPGDLHVQNLSLLNSIWQYIYVGLVDRKNIQGLQQAVILYGGYNKASQTEAFLRNLTKLAEDGIVQAYDVLLRLAAKSINSLGLHFHLILKFVFEMQEGSMSTQSTLDSSIVDVIFTSTASLPDEKFIQLLHSFCKFAYSNINDAKYSRQLFVLKHLIEIIDYNLKRIASIWPPVWRILQDFFIRMGLHPKQTIAMAAVDSLKQVALKLMKIPESHPFEQKSYLSPFLDIFDRSNGTVKQLIVSILGMCINKQLKSGWDVIFEILQKAQNDAVLRVINRIVEIGLENIIDQQNRLHNIIVNKVTLGPINELSLDLLIRITQYFSTQENWIESLKTIKNKFKATLSLQVLKRFFSIINLLSFKNSSVFQQIQQLNIFAADAGILEAEEVFSQTNLLKPEFIVFHYQQIAKLWEILLTSLNKQIYLKYFQQQLLILSQYLSTEQLENTYIFLIQKLNETNPTTLDEIKKLDPDFQKVIDDLPSQQTGTDLIQLDLERQHFFFRAMLHVVVLETLTLLINKRPLDNQKLLNSLLKEAQSSYDLSSSFNKRVLLRLFLWKNGFFKGNKLSGLLKQQILSINLLTVLCTSSTIQTHSSNIISQYLKLIKLANQISGSVISQSLKEIYKEQITLKIHNYKNVLIKLLRKVGEYQNFNKPKEMYDLILNLMEVVNPQQIIRAGQAPLQKLLTQIIRQKS